ncbi:MAG: EamA/RhaT family transporter [Paracoccaceae bacterium]
MNNRHPLFGLALATFGALLITPDGLFMRLSEMSGLALAGWRGLLTGVAYTGAWMILRRGHLGADLRLLVGPVGLLLVFCQASNASLFSLGIAVAPVSVVLFGVATVPLCAAFFSWLVAGEVARAATWAATAAVLAGIGLAVFGRGGEAIGLNANSLAGAAAGLAVAASLALIFVFLRHRRELPILPVMGLGSLLSGTIAVTIIGPAELFDGQVWAALASGVFILPLSFLALTYASRYTSAMNVSLLLLLETILGPAWVWWGYGEAMTVGEITGGAIVVVSLAAYLLHSARTSTTAAA